MRFRALTDFWSDEVKSQYGRNLLYTARTEKLRELVKQWVAERKVEIVDSGTDAIISGHGQAPPESLWTHIKRAIGWR